VQQQYTTTKTKLEKIMWADGGSTHPISNLKSSENPVGTEFIDPLIGRWSKKTCIRAVEQTTPPSKHASLDLKKHNQKCLILKLCYSSFLEKHDINVI
jgi:hypothetical protein